MLLLKHKSCKETKANLAVGCAKLLQILLTKKKKKNVKDSARPTMLPIKVQIDQSATNGLGIKVLKHLGII